MVDGFNLWFGKIWTNSAFGLNQPIDNILPNYELKQTSIYPRVYLNEKYKES